MKRSIILEGYLENLTIVLQASFNEDIDSSDIFLECTETDTERAVTYRIMPHEVSILHKLFTKLKTELEEG